MHKNTIGRSRWAITRGGQAANYANVSVENRAPTRSVCRYERDRTTSGLQADLVYSMGAATWPADVVVVRAAPGISIRFGDADAVAGAWKVNIHVPRGLY